MTARSNGGLPLSASWPHRQGPCLRRPHMKCPRPSRPWSRSTRPTSLRHGRCGGGRVGAAVVLRTRQCPSRHRSRQSCLAQDMHPRLPSVTSPSPPCSSCCRSASVPSTGHPRPGTRSGGPRLARAPRCDDSRLGGRLWHRRPISDLSGTVRGKTASPSPLCHRATQATLSCADAPPAAPPNILVALQKINGDEDKGIEDIWFDPSAPGAPRCRAPLDWPLSWMPWARKPKFQVRHQLTMGMCHSDAPGAIRSQRECPAPSTPQPLAHTFVHQFTALCLPRCRLSAMSPWLSTLFARRGPRTCCSRWRRTSPGGSRRRRWRGGTAVRRGHPRMMPHQR
jgi:hypothetical protein